MPELRYDPLRLRWSIIAAERSQRPHVLGTKQEDDIKPHDSSCPFCEGAEAQTPPEIFALGRDNSNPDEPGWQVRVVPNKFPALRLDGDLRREGVGLFDLASSAPRTLSFRFETGTTPESQRLRFHVFVAPEHVTILDEYTALTGRPFVPPDWAFKNWRWRGELYPVTRGANVVSIFLVVLSAGTLVVQAMTPVPRWLPEISSEERAELMRARATSRDRPDIYYILLDGYARADVLEHRGAAPEGRQRRDRAHQGSLGCSRDIR